MFASGMTIPAGVLRGDQSIRCSGIARSAVASFRGGAPGRDDAVVARLDAGPNTPMVGPLGLGARRLLGTGRLDNHDDGPRHRARQRISMAPA